MAEAKEKERDKFNYVKLRIEKYQKDIDEGIIFLHSIVHKKDNKQNIDVRDYLCLVYYIKLLEEKYLSLRVDFSDTILRWSIRDKSDLDHMVVVVCGLKKKVGKNLHEFTEEEIKQINVDKETWEKYLFIEKLIDLDRFGCIQRDVERLQYIYNDDIGNMLIAGVNVINSRNIERLYGFLKQLKLFMGEEILEQKIEKFVSEEQLQQMQMQLQQNIQDTMLVVHDIQKGFDEMRERFEQLESRINEISEGQLGREKEFEKEQSFSYEELEDRFNVLEGKIFEFEQKLSELEQENKFGKEERWSQGSETVEERIGHLETRLLNLEIKLEEFERNIDKKMQEMLQKVQEVKVTEKEKQMLLNKQINEEETEPIVITEEEEEEEKEKKVEKKKKKLIDFKVLAIVWVIVFVLFLVVGFLLR